MEKKEALEVIDAVALELAEASTINYVKRFSNEKKNVKNQSKEYCTENINGCNDCHMDHFSVLHRCKSMVANNAVCCINCLFTILF